MVIVTGDTHRFFDHIFDFCEEYQTAREDVLVILGDAGINYYLDDSDRRIKEMLSALPVTLLAIQGNHEQRPSEISSYEEVPWRGGVVYQEPEFPNLLFAKDGEIYQLEGRSAIAIGGAYSVDKYDRLQSGEPWFPTEQPDEDIKAYVERQLEKAGWQVDYVFSHTSPFRYEPRHAFLPEIDQDRVDKSTEKWLDTIESRLSYEGWYCGHFHIDEQIFSLRIVQDDFLELDTDCSWEDG